MNIRILGSIIVASILGLSGFYVVGSNQPTQPVIPKQTFDTNSEIVFSAEPEPIIESVNTTIPVVNTTNTSNVDTGNWIIIQDEPDPPVYDEPVADPPILDDPFVNDSNTTNDTIQSLIDAVEEGGTVYIPNGTFYENLVINKSVNVIGNNTIIDGQNLDDTLRIVADNVTITGVSFINSSYGQWCDGGVDIEDSSNICISNCSFYQNGYAGIRCYSIDAVGFINCQFYNNRGEGLFMEYASNVQIVNCTFIGLNNRCRIDHYSYNVTISNCTSKDGASFLLEQGCYNNLVTNCTTINCTYGLSILQGWDYEEPYQNTIENCSFINNSLGVRIICANDNVFTNNNFVNNIEQASDDSANYFDGNYWSDWNGTGPYNYTGGQDLNPLYQLVV